MTQSSNRGETGLTIGVRRQLFAKLVEIEDEGNIHLIKESYALLMVRYPELNLTPEVLKVIEDEGLDKLWSPIGDGNYRERVLVGRNLPGVAHDSEDQDASP